MDLAAFKASLAAARPPRGLSPPLRALWWAAKGNWAKAHDLAQTRDDKPSAWVHAYLHRLEGDKDNAAYWYQRGGRKPPTGPSRSEWTSIVRTLL